MSINSGSEVVCVVPVEDSERGIFRNGLLLFCMICNDFVVGCTEREPNVCVTKFLKCGSESGSLLSVSLYPRCRPLYRAYFRVNADRMLQTGRRSRLPWSNVAASAFSCTPGIIIYTFIYVYICTYIQNGFS